MSPACFGRSVRGRARPGADSRWHRSERDLATPRVGGPCSTRGRSPLSPRTTGEGVARPGRTASWGLGLEQLVLGRVKQLTEATTGPALSRGKRPSEVGEPRGGLNDATTLGEPHPPTCLLQVAIDANSLGIHEPEMELGLGQPVPGSFQEPACCELEVLRGTDACADHRGQVELRPWQAALGGSAKPLHGLYGVPLNPVARAVLRSQISLRLEVASLCTSCKGVVYDAASQRQGQENEGACSCHRGCTILDGSDGGARTMPGPSVRAGRQWSSRWERVILVCASRARWSSG